MSTREDLLRKLKALAEGGVGGEKVNAEKMLNKLLTKYNIDPDSLESDSLRMVEFKVKKGQFQRDILTQVIANCLPTLKRSNRKTKNGFICQVSIVEEIEIRAKYTFYSERFKDDLLIMFNAFIHKNDLFYKGETESQFTDKPINYEQATRILQMMNGLKKHHYATQIEHKRDGEKS